MWHISSFWTPQLAELQIHISLICRCCFFHIRDLSRIRRCISLSVPKTIATALITSRLDYCNSLLYKLHLTRDILKLQCVQNCLARVVRRFPRFSHSILLQKSLHWLPVQSRIIFKLCTAAYQTLSSGEPSYLFSMLSLAPISPEYSVHLVFICRLFPGLKLILGLVLFSVALSLLFETLSLNLLNHQIG